MTLRGAVARFPAWIVIAGAVALAGCAETQIVSHTAKEIKEATESAPPAANPYYKVGKPYQVDSVWYYPAIDNTYIATGIASWYGEEFHGKPTANGEIFDMNELTAAHKTLPMPSVVRVTNLENGRSILVRVNDRGPFVHGRIIDLSRRSAQLLGFEQAGTAKVRVVIDAEESRLAQAALPRDPKDGAVPEPIVAAAPRVAVEQEALPDAPPPEPAPWPRTVAGGGATALVGAANTGSTEPPPADVVQGAPEPANLYVQAGAFSQFENAHRLQAKLTPIGSAQISPVFKGDTQFFRVRLGPLDDLDAADRLLERVIKAGYKNAELIVAE